jgi:soluble lytic murein transglycosylase-like protein
MSIDPAAAGRSSEAHVSLFEAGLIARGQGTASASKPAPFRMPSTAAKTGSSSAARPAAARASTTARTSVSRSFSPHTAIESHSTADPDQWDGMLNRIGNKYNVPPLFLKAVMLSESGGRPDAVGDSGHSVGLFQLHDHGYGAGMGDSRFDPEVNADRGARGLAEAWNAGEKAGFRGEQAVRAAYDYSFNPGGGWAYQGDSVVQHMNQLLAEQGQAPLT